MLLHHVHHHYINHSAVMGVWATNTIVLNRKMTSLQIEYDVIGLVVRSALGDIFIQPIAVMVVFAERDKSICCQVNISTFGNHNIARILVSVGFVLVFTANNFVLKFKSKFRVVVDLTERNIPLCQDRSRNPSLSVCWWWQSCQTLVNQRSRLACVKTPVRNIVIIHDVLTESQLDQVT